MPESSLSVRKHAESPESPALVGDHSSTQHELTTGLQSRPAHIAPKYLYDTLGSKLFEAICLLPEYYPTRTEAAILQAQSAAIAQAIGPGSVLIDLGAGNCAKAANLFPVLSPSHYVPVDISADFLKKAIEPLRQRYPDISITPLGQDFSQSLTLPATLPGEKRVFFYPGSSIGNFTPAQATEFLQRLHVAGGPDATLLLGIDLVKDPAVLQAAYDDSLGVTAAFNLNILNHLNAVLGSNFQTVDWEHSALFNPERHRIEMYLKARRKVDVHWLGHTRIFEKDECIHTENSYKYTRQSIADLLQQAGFQEIAFWSDPHDWFSVVLARPLQTRPHIKRML